MTALHAAAENNAPAELTRLLQTGADADTRDESGRTPLMSACRSGHETCARLLIQAGADINATVDEGETALTLAVQEGHAGCVRLLRAAGAHE